MIRYIILLICFILPYIKGFSQDLLIQTNGDTVAISVIELNYTHFFYNKIGFGERMFSTPRDYLKKILYKNGSFYLFGKEKESQKSKLKRAAVAGGILYVENGLFAPSIETKNRVLSSKEVVQLYRDIGNEKAVKLFQKGRTQNIVGNILSMPAGFFLGRELARAINSSKSTNSAIIIASSVVGIISITLNIQGTKKIKDSVKSYNHIVLMELGATQNGIGMQMNF